MLFYDTKIFNHTVMEVTRTLRCRTKLHISVMSRPVRCAIECPTYVVKHSNNKLISLKIKAFGNICATFLSYRCLRVDTLTWRVHMRSYKVRSSSFKQKMHLLMRCVHSHVLARCACSYCIESHVSLTLYTPESRVARSSSCSGLKFI